MDKHKLLAPWVSHAYQKNAFCRKSLKPFFKEAMAIVYKQVSNAYWYGTETGVSTFETKREAMEATDRHLEELGYILLTQEQYDKLIVLA